MALVTNYAQQPQNNPYNNYRFNTGRVGIKNLNEGDSGGDVPPPDDTVGPPPPPPNNPPPGGGPPPPTSPPPDNPPPDNGPPPDDGGFNIAEFLKKYLTNGSGGMSSFLPALMQAWQQYNNAGRYEDLGRTAADMANPFGDRSYYRDRLRQSYDDPSAILNDPGHKISVQRGLDTVQAQNAAKGYLGSGNMLVDLSKYASDSDATYLDQERKSLSNLAGAQFDPQNAATDLLRGGEMGINSRNAALGALFTQFNNGNSPENKKPPGNGPDGYPKIPLDPTTGLPDLSKIKDPLARLQQMWKESGPAAGPASQWIRDQMNKGITVDPQDPHIAQAIAEMDKTQPDYFDRGSQPDNPYGPNPDTPSPDPTGGGAGIDWDNPGDVDWGNVDFSNFTDSDWSKFSDYFSQFDGG